MYGTLRSQNEEKQNQLTEKTPLIGQQRHLYPRFFLPTRSSSAPPSVALKMASAVSAAPLRSIYLGVDVGTGSARAGPFLSPKYDVVSLRIRNWLLPCFRILIIFLLCLPLCLTFILSSLFYCTKFVNLWIYCFLCLRCLWKKNNCCCCC